MRCTSILLAATFLLTGNFAATAQMKSCCDPEGTKLLSTVKQTAGTLRMAKILDSINRYCNPEDFMVMNAEKVDLIKKKLAVEKDANKRFNLYFQYATESLNAGNIEESVNVLKQMLAASKLTNENFPPQYKPLFDQLAIAYMRRGEQENCAANHNPESCIIPIQGNGIHKLTSGSEQAIEVYKSILTKFPDDLQSRYLLNVAYMTLGKYPAEVPARLATAAHHLTRNRDSRQCR